MRSACFLIRASLVDNCLAALTVASTCLTLLISVMEDSLIILLDVHILIDAINSLRLYDAS